MTGPMSSETITAPDGAVRMALFMGLTPCKGQVNFDDINITTANGGGVSGGRAGGSGAEIEEELLIRFTVTRTNIERI